MRTASISEAKNNLSALLDLVRGGETVVILDRGRPVAQLGAVPRSSSLEPRFARLERAGLLRRGTGDLQAALQGPAARLASGDGRAALEALLEERRGGR